MEYLVTIREATIAESGAIASNKPLPPLVSGEVWWIEPTIVRVKSREAEKYETAHAIGGLVNRDGEWFRVIKIERA